MSQDVVLYEVRSGVAVLTLNRPDRLNAWTPSMDRRYFALLERAATDPDVRAIVVTGAGRGFCAGGDMEGLGSLVSEGADVYEGSAKPHTYTLSVPKPVIAAINGACAGLGLSVALMCDLRFAAAGAKLTTAFARRGLIAEHASSWILPRLIGHARALDLLLSGRVVLAEEALALGMVNRVVGPEALLEETMTYARDLVTHCSPTSVALIKGQVYGDWDRDLETALREADRLMLESHRSPDAREGVASFVERRPPAFLPYRAEPGTATDRRAP